MNKSNSQEKIAAEEQVILDNETQAENSVDESGGETISSEWSDSSSTERAFQFILNQSQVSFYQMIYSNIFGAGKRRS